MADIKKQKQDYAELFNKFPLGLCVFEIDVNDNGAPVDVRWVFVNKAYAAMTKRSADAYKDLAISKSVIENKNGWIYTIWNVGCNGSPQEIEYLDTGIDRYFVCNLFQLEYGVCGCFLRDNTISHRANEMFQNTVNRRHEELNPTEEYVFKYESYNDTFLYVLCVDNQRINRNKIYGKIKDFREKMMEGINVQGFSKEIADSVLCSKHGGIAELKLLGYNKRFSHSEWFRVKSVAVPRENNHYTVVGTMTKIKVD